MGLGSLLGGEALKELVRLTPQIITAAQQVYSTVNRNRRQGNDPDLTLPSRLAMLEAADVAQSDLLEQMARQLQAQSNALESLAFRIRIIGVLAAGSLAMSLFIAVALVLMK